MPPLSLVVWCDPVPDSAPDRLCPSAGSYRASEGGAELPEATGWPKPARLRAYNGSKACA